MIIIRYGKGTTKNGSVEINLNEKCVHNYFNYGCFNHKRYNYYNYSVQVTSIKEYVQLFVSEIVEGKFTVHSTNENKDCSFYWTIYCDQEDDEYIGF
jgi:hypothetical protein